MRSFRKSLAKLQALLLPLEPELEDVVLPLEEVDEVDPLDDEVDEEDEDDEDEAFGSPLDGGGRTALLFSSGPGVPGGMSASESAHAAAARRSEEESTIPATSFMAGSAPYHLIPVRQSKVSFPHFLRPIRSAPALAWAAVRRALGLLVFAVVFLAAAAVRAQKPISKTTEYSSYEQDIIRRVLKKTGYEVDLAPEGKIIGRVDVVRLEVLDERDPGPDILKPVPILSPIGKPPISHYFNKNTLNALHTTTREYIVLREMLLRPGDRYVQVIIDETARNMRSRMPFQVSVVIILPIRTEDPDRVDLLVITKDIWSLRLSFDTSITPGGLESFVLVPQETNFLGLHHTVQTRFVYLPESLTFGVGYAIPRFGYSWIGASAGASIIINQRTSTPEGSSVSAQVGQGLYSTRTEWAWSAEAGYSVAVTRRYSNARVLLFDARSTPQRDGIPWEYRAGAATGSVGVTRSFGWGFKNNFSLSMNASTSNCETFDLSRYDPRAAREFVLRALPICETRVYPAFTWASFTTNFLRTLEINTLGLQEDYRLGHEVSASIYPVTKSLGSTRNFVGFGANIGYTVALGDGLVGANASASAEVTGEDPRPGIPPDERDRLAISDGSAGFSFGAVTPRLGIGRIVMNISALNRYRNYLNGRSFTGGEDRLRGYPSNFFFGKDTVFYNIEFRSRGIEILTAQVGAVVFYDAGDAAFAWDLLRPKQSVGFGFRGLFPQINRAVFRIDFAFPLNRGPFPETGVDAPVDPFGFYLAFNQAFAP